MENAYGKVGRWHTAGSMMWFPHMQVLQQFEALRNSSWRSIDAAKTVEQVHEQVPSCALPCEPPHTPAPLPLLGSGAMTAAACGAGANARTGGVRAGGGRGSADVSVGRAAVRRAPPRDCEPCVGRAPGLYMRGGVDVSGGAANM